MKGLSFLSAAYLLVPLLPTAIAYGERGIAERMLYFVAYLCEEETKALDPGYTYTVAPGCTGSRGGRCTMDEFLMYIWAEKEGGTMPDTVRPTGMKVSTNIQGRPALSFNQFEGAVQNARFNTGLPVDGNADSSKLFPGSTDYYDALAKMGAPMEAFSKAVIAAKQANSAFKLSYRPKLWQLGKDCTAYVTALRRKDMDGYRVAWLKEKISGFEPVMKNFDTAKTSGNTKTPMSIPVIDFDASIDQYKGSISNIADQLVAQNTAFMNVQKTPGEFINRNHLKATEAARFAMTACNCERGFPRELKKRQFHHKKRHAKTLKTRAEIWETNPAAVNWGGPKAAQSRKMRAQRLALIGAKPKAH